MKNETFARWMTIGTALFLGTACLGILVLRLGLRLSWSALVIPIVSYTVLQIAFFAAIFWARKYKNLRIAAPIIGAYSAGAGSMLIHYASHWGLRTGLGDHDLWGFNISIVAIVIGLALMPTRWSQRFFTEGMMCVRCHHYHEGHDCPCGCKASQFKYPSFGI